MPQILIIDDDPSMQIILRKALQDQGYSLEVASNGEEGLIKAHELHPDLIICDWVMPRVDGLEVCRQVKANVDLSLAFFILLTARGSIEDRVKGLDNGADDFLAKPIEITELQARVRAGLRLRQLSQDLQAQKQLLERELAEAASYVRSLLPKPTTGLVTIDSRFIPSSQLGGDCYDFYWLDPDYLAVYLLDVSGHGLGAALPSITILNLLRSQSLPNVNFYQPHTVLRALNETFQMDEQNDKYFTIWYGVYNRAKRQLSYSTAGHPPGLLLVPGEGGHRRVEQLKTPGMPVGMMLDESYVSYRCDIPPNSTLYIFSDGIYDIPTRPDAPGWNFNYLVDALTDYPKHRNLDHLLDIIREATGSVSFGDDLSVLELTFD